VIGGRPPLTVAENNALVQLAANNNPNLTRLNASCVAMVQEATQPQNQRANTNLFLNDDSRRKCQAWWTAVQALIGANCHVCEQPGHDMEQCATLKNMNSLAKKHSVSWEWGATKGAVYYQAYAAANPNLIIQNKLDKLQRGRSRSKRR